MKVIKALLIGFVVLALVVIAGAFVFIKTFDINRYKPQVVGMASRALNRQVDFEKAFLGISLRQGISIKINNLSVADDPVFQKGEFLFAKDISLAVDVWGYLFHKKVDVSSVHVDALRVKIIRQKDGSINVQTMAQPAAASVMEQAAGQAASQASAQKSAQASASMALPAVLVSSLEIGNGTLTYIDRSFEPALEAIVSDLTVTASRISLTDAFPFVIEGAVLSARRNIRFEGKAQVDISSGGLRIFEGKGASDLSQIVLARIPVSFPAAKGAILPVSLTGKATIALEKMATGPKGLEALAADVSLAEGGMKFKEMAVPVRDVQMRAQVSESAMRVEKSSARVGEGLIQGSALLDDYLATQKFDFNLTMDKVKIQDLVAPGSMPVKPEGVISAQLTVKGEGLSPQALNSSLSGQGTVEAAQILLKDINLLRTVLDKVSVIPRLAEKIEANLPEKYKQKLAQKDTALSDIKLPVIIENGRIVIKDMALGADDFSLKGRSEAGFNGSFLLEGSFLISPELSAAMVAAVPELQYVLNEDKQVLIPVKVSGKPAGAKFSVDAEYMAKRLVINQGAQQLFKVLEKALGKKEPEAAPSAGPQGAGSAASTAPQTDTQAATDTEPASRESIGGLIDTLFKK